MNSSLGNIRKLIDTFRSSCPGSKPSIVVRAATYRELLHIQSLWNRGKPYVRARHMQHKSIMRMPRAIREDARQARYRRMYMSRQAVWDRFRRLSGSNYWGYADRKVTYDHI
jgi:hypothetical protein